MNTVKFLIVALAFILVFSSAQAAVRGIPTSIEFHETVEQIEFSVSNDSGSTQLLEVQLFLPVDYDFLDKPEFVEAGESATVKVALYPREDLIGTVYNSMIVVSLGNDVYELPVRVSFEENQECQLVYKARSRTQDVNGLTELYVDIEIYNPYPKAMDVEFRGINGLPFGWSYSPANTTITIAALEKQGISVELTAGSAFDGNAFVLVSCPGFDDVEERVEISHEGTGILSGFFAFGNLFDDSEFALEIILDVLLALVAAVLLIAFIARFVKRVR